jgi:hypothetical protein
MNKVRIPKELFENLDDAMENLKTALRSRDWDLAHFAATQFMNTVMNRFEEERTDNVRPFRYDGDFPGGAA